MSKSGLYAHFGSKEELQLATIDAASDIFVREVIEPARTAEGAARLNALAGAFLSYLERKVFPGGCFFAAAQAELDTHPGPCARSCARRAAAGSTTSRSRCAAPRRWASSVTDEDPAQLAFEIDAMLKMATALFVLHDDPEALERARRGVETRVDRAKIGA